MILFYAHQLVILLTAIAVVLGVLLIQPQRRSQQLLIIWAVTTITAIMVIVTALLGFTVLTLVIGTLSTIGITIYAFIHVPRRRTLIAGCLLAVPCFLAAYPVAQHFEVATPGLVSISATEGVVVALTLMWLWPMGMTSLWWSHDFHHETTRSGDERAE